MKKYIPQKIKEVTSGEPAGLTMVMQVMNIAAAIPSIKRAKRQLAPDFKFLRGGDFLQLGKQLWIFLQLVKLLVCSWMLHLQLLRDLAGA